MQEEKSKKEKKKVSTKSDRQIKMRQSARRTWSRKKRKWILG